MNAGISTYSAVEAALIDFRFSSQVVRAGRERHLVVTAGAFIEVAGARVYHHESAAAAMPKGVRSTKVPEDLVESLQPQAKNKLIEAATNALKYQAALRYAMTEAFRNNLGSTVKWLMDSIFLSSQTDKYGFRGFLMRDGDQNTTGGDADALRIILQRLINFNPLLVSLTPDVIRSIAAAPAAETAESVTAEIEGLARKLGVMLGGKTVKVRYEMY